jgi:hypothetical protein
VPMGLVQTKMPDELLDDERKDRIFYSEDGGVRATHEDGTPGDEIYYLGIIDCLTHVSRFQNPLTSPRKHAHNCSPVVRVCETS